MTARLSYSCCSYTVCVLVLFHQYKAGIGALLREGAIVVTEDSLTLVPEADRQPMPAEPYSGKSPRGWAAPDAAVLFVGNLGFNVDKMELAAAIEQVHPYLSPI